MIDKKERPINFLDEMIPAILDGRRTQTRRPLKTQPTGVGCSDNDPATQLHYELSYGGRHCPFGQVGDRLWVKEKALYWGGGSSGTMDGDVKYFDDPEIPALLKDNEALNIINDPRIGRWRWKFAKLMPRWASRITLEITGVRVERVQDITTEDCIAEGVKTIHTVYTPHSHFRAIWNSIYASRRPIRKNRVIVAYESFPWYGESGTFEYKGKPHYVYANPWVWVIEFRRIEK